MAQSQDIPAWIALFLALYMLSASVGELRKPGGWAAMVEDFAKSAGLRYLTGVFCIALGAAIYLVTPWRPDDLLAIAVSVIGGICALEGMLILAAGDRFVSFAKALMSKAGGVWAGAAALVGAGLLFAALSRIGVAAS
ncbi:hypothetical protein [Paraurantiacibacter namhicola]|uniref:Uncharacterized protein n=1 Tax=Paraurantiacibacter namhicola TaxID=645517 RepID=A0A1C7D704_9SPHN|nr:hypothetical protein [Paraurantiacibacter namhicola]ANU07249.1 hypothetical protein A6F65_00939 [Paraurantiacibacter namhicola]